MTEGNKNLFPRIYEVVRQVPHGCVASYGKIAEIVGPGCDARTVGYAMAGTPEGSDIPWQRIVNREGKISLPGRGGQIQRMRLEAEGVVFDARNRIDMARFGWAGPDPAWAAEHGYHVKPHTQKEPGQSQPPLF
jgi:methylated-DNA-protein-cysteine methyltransferase related protein